MRRTNPDSTSKIRRTADSSACFTVSCTDSGRTALLCFQLAGSEKSKAVLPKGQRIAFGLPRAAYHRQITRAEARTHFKHQSAYGAI